MKSANGKNKEIFQSELKKKRAGKQSCKQRLKLRELEQYEHRRKEHLAVILEFFPQVHRYNIQKSFDDAKISDIEFYNLLCNF